MSAGWKLASCLAVVAILTGCADTMPLLNLPDITKLPEKVLNKDEQQRAMNQMIEKGQAQQAEAAKQAEKAR